MNCTTAQSLLQPYLDGALDPVDARSIESHMTRCTDCRAELIQLERLMLALESLPRLAAPSDLVPRAMAGVARMERRQDLWRRSRGPALVAALTTLLAGIFLTAGTLDSELDLAALVLDQHSPATVFEALAALAVSLESSLILGLGLLFVAGCITLIQLVIPERETTGI